MRLTTKPFIVYVFLVLVIRKEQRDKHKTEVCFSPQWRIQRLKMQSLSSLTTARPHGSLRRPPFPSTAPQFPTLYKADKGATVVVLFRFYVYIMAPQQANSFQIKGKHALILGMPVNATSQRSKLTVVKTTTMNTHAIQPYSYRQQHNDHSGAGPNLSCHPERYEEGDAPSKNLFR